MLPRDLQNLAHSLEITPIQEVVPSIRSTRGSLILGQQKSTANHRTSFQSFHLFCNNWLLGWMTLGPAPSNHILFGYLQNMTLSNYFKFSFGIQKWSVHVWQETIVIWKESIFKISWRMVFNFIHTLVSLQGQDRCLISFPWLPQMRPQPKAYISKRPRSTAMVPWLWRRG